MIDAPTTINNTGTWDVTAELTDWLNTLPDGETARLSGTFMVGGTIKIVGRKVTIDGTGAKLLQWGFGREAPDPRTRCVLRFVNSTGSLTGLEIQGANPLAGTGDLAYVKAFEAQHGVWIEGGTIEVAHCNIHDVYGDFIYVAGQSPDAHIHDNVCMRNGRQGISVSRGSAVVENNTLDQMRRAVFDLEPAASSWVVDGVTIRNNFIGKHRLNFLSSLGLGAVHNVTVSNNLLCASTMNAQVASAAVRKSGWVVDGNVSTGKFGSPSGHVMSFTNVDDVTVTNNRQPSDRRITELAAYVGCTGIDDHDNLLV